MAKRIYGKLDDGKEVLLATYEVECNFSGVATIDFKNKHGYDEDCLMVMMLEHTTIDCGYYCSLFLVSDNGSEYYFYTNYDECENTISEKGGELILRPINRPRGLSSREWFGNIIKEELEG